MSLKMIRAKCKTAAESIFLPGIQKNLNASKY